MKIIVGLGNPGREYENTRHNVGFLVLDALKNQIQNSKFKIQNYQMNNKFHAEICQVEDVLLVKPQTFMNDSGKSVAAVSSFYKINMDDLYVVHDDLDIVMGEFKIQKGKGPKIHNGINDIEEKLGRGDFWRVRVGVENRHLKVPNNKLQITNKLQFLNFLNKKQEKIPGRQYVLMKLGKDEERAMESVANEIVKQLSEKLGL